MAVPLTIENLYGGGAVERLHGAIEEALKNIIDPNTPAKKVRKLKLTQDGPRFALFEADNGAWENEAMKNIKHFLEFEIPELHVIA